MAGAIIPDAPKVIVSVDTESSPLLGSSLPESKSKDSTVWSEILYLVSSAPLVSRPQPRTQSYLQNLLSNLIIDISRLLLTK